MWALSCLLCVGSDDDRQRGLGWQVARGRLLLIRLGHGRLTTSATTDSGCPCLG